MHSRCAPRPDHISSPFVLPACVRSCPSRFGSQLRALVYMSGLHSNRIIHKSLIHFYSNYRESEHAQKVFDEMPEGEVVSWTSMIHRFVDDAVRPVPRQTVAYPMARLSSSSSLTYLVRRGQTCGLTTAMDAGGRNIEEQPHSSRQHLLEDVAKQICRITRTRPRWEDTLLHDFPSFDFFDPIFLNAFFSHQGNALLSLRFFRWLMSSEDRSSKLHPSSCHALFDALVGANASIAAKSFLDSTNFSPSSESLESYVQCLCGDGLIQEALDVVDKLIDSGVRPSVITWNCALLGSLEIGRTDFFWVLYGKMMELGVGGDVDTAGYLIQAFCDDNKVKEAHELLQKIMQDGVVPSNAAFIKLISGYYENESYANVSSLLHAMIARDRVPDLSIYQKIMLALFKRRKYPKAFQIFNDLKDRGYAPDRFMYTTVIHGLCEMNRVGEARKVWFEMIRKGILPNEHTYNALIHGFCKIGDMEQAWTMYKEICEKGRRKTMITFNTIIGGLCSNGRSMEAHGLFFKMTQKGMAPDMITYNFLIGGFCVEGKVVESMKLLEELKSQGLQPSNSSYMYIIKTLCETGNVQKAKFYFKEMQDEGVQPATCTFDFIISALCQLGYAAEAKEWLTEMLRSDLRPQKETFEGLIQCLLQREMFDDALLIFNAMFKLGYTLREHLYHSLVNKVCKEDSQHVLQTCLQDTSIPW